jgi:adenine specific DNA methylase Mod
MNSAKKEQLKFQCFRCQGEVKVKYNTKTHDYSKKNSWSYWTEKKAEDSKEQDYICDDCLIELFYRYKKEFRKYIPNKKKQHLLRLYIDEGIIGTKKPFFLLEC